MVKGAKPTLIFQRERKSSLPDQIPNLSDMSGKEVASYAARLLEELISAWKDAGDARQNRATASGRHASEAADGRYRWLQFRATLILAWLQRRCPAECESRGINDRSIYLGHELSEDVKWALAFVGASAKKLTLPAGVNWYVRAKEMEIAEPRAMSLRGALQLMERLSSYPDVSRECRRSKSLEGSTLPDLEKLRLRLKHWVNLRFPSLFGSLSTLLSPVAYPLCRVSFQDSDWNRDVNQLTAEIERKLYRLGLSSSSPRREPRPGQALLVNDIAQRDDGKLTANERAEAAEYLAGEILEARAKAKRLEDLRWRLETFPNNHRGFYGGPLSEDHLAQLSLLPVEATQNLALRCEPDSRFPPPTYLEVAERVHKLRIVELAAKEDLARYLEVVRKLTDKEWDPSEIDERLVGRLLRVAAQAKKDARASEPKTSDVPSIPDGSPPKKPDRSTDLRHPVKPKKKRRGRGEPAVLIHSVLVDHHSGPDARRTISLTLLDIRRAAGVGKGSVVSFFRKYMPPGYKDYEGYKTFVRDHFANLARLLQSIGTRVHRDADRRAKAYDSKAS